MFFELGGRRIEVWISAIVRVARLDIFNPDDVKTWRPGVCAVQGDESGARRW